MDKEPNWMKVTHNFYDPVKSEAWEGKVGHVVVELTTGPVKQFFGMSKSDAKALRDCIDATIKLMEATE